MRDVAILSAVRTPIGRAPKGNLRQTRPDDLGALAAREALRRAEVDPAAVEDLVPAAPTPRPSRASTSRGRSASSPACPTRRPP
jgi:acetyl-CoA acyltransferase